MPRWATGTWSGSTATWAASSALKKTCATHQPSSTTATFGASATTRIPAVPPTRPPTIHGRRLPNRDVVRSLSPPQIGLATIATSAPTPVTSDRLAGARSMPTRALTLRARVTSSGATNSKAVLRYASAYRPMKPRPTRCSAAGAAADVVPDIVPPRLGSDGSPSPTTAQMRRGPSGPHGDGQEHDGVHDSLEGVSRVGDEHEVARRPVPAVLAGHEGDPTVEDSEGARKLRCPRDVEAPAGPAAIRSSPAPLSASA